MAGKVRVTVKEKILIGLLSFTKHKDEFEVPPDITQDGLATAVGTRRSHIASALKDLKQNELVEEKKTRISGHERRKNAYFLTHLGQAEALSLREGVMEKEITLILQDGTKKELKISELKDHMEKKLKILEILNGLSDDGVFSEKKEEKEEEDETWVICPLCSEKNYNFEPNLIQLQEGTRGYSVTCTHCQRNFLVGEVSLADYEVSKEIAPTFAPHEGMPRYIPQKAYPHQRALYVSLGLVLMLVSFILALLMGFEYLANDFFVLVLLGLTISFLLLFLGLQEAKQLDLATRKVLILTGIVFMGFIAVFFGIIFDAAYEREQILLMILILVPAFGVFIFGKPLSSDIRSELALSLGVFLVLFGFFSYIFPDLFSWSTAFSPFWVISGAAMIMASHEIAKPERTFFIRAACVGAGAFCAVFCVTVLLSGYFKLGLWKAAGAVLWLFFGLFLLSVRFVSDDSWEKVRTSLKSALFLGVGVLFVLVGILLAMNQRYMACAVELFIGIPILWYGLYNVKEHKLPQIIVMCFVIASEIILVLSLALT